VAPTAAVAVAEMGAAGRRLSPLAVALMGAAERRLSLLAVAVLWISRFLVA
jgi:hypothetical protein